MTFPPVYSQNHCAYTTLIFVLLGIDQILKFLVSCFVALESEISFGLFSITHLYNPNLNNIPASILILTLLAAFLNHPRIWESFGDNHIAMNTAFACMIAGMLGNMLDMIFYTQVLDFYMIPISAPNYYLVANFADFCIFSAYFFTCLGLYKTLETQLCQKPKRLILS